MKNGGEKQMLWHFPQGTLTHWYMQTHIHFNGEFSSLEVENKSKPKGSQIILMVN